MKWYHRLYKVYLTPPKGHSHKTFHSLSLFGSNDDDDYGFFAKKLYFRQNFFLCSKPGRRAPIEGRKQRRVHHYSIKWIKSERQFLLGAFARLYTPWESSVSPCLIKDEKELKLPLLPPPSNTPINSLLLTPLLFLPFSLMVSSSSSLSNSNTNTSEPTWYKCTKQIQILLLTPSSFQPIGQKG